VLCWQNAENDVESRKPAYNVEQLEECDLMPDDASAISLFDGETHKVVQQVIYHAIALTFWLSGKKVCQSVIRKLKLSP